MGLHEDIDQFRAIGEDNRMDLEDFIEHGQLQTPSGDIRVPIKIIDLPEFAYEMMQQGGVGQAGDGDDPQQGDPVDSPEGDGEGEAGTEPGEHGHYEMDPEEFAEELDEELDLNLEPKGKRVKEKVVGDLVDVSRAGPQSALDVEYMFTEGLKRKLAMWYDEDFLRELCCVSGFDADDVFEVARSQYSMPVDRATVGAVFTDARPCPMDQMYDGVAELESEYGAPRRGPPSHEIDDVPFRQEDERYRHPEIEKKMAKDVVIVNIRDVSGSMHAGKRELVERVFTPMDWYLQGKYDEAEFVYIAHDSEAWEVDRMDFFGINSSGGTRVSSAYKLAKQILEEHYPWSEWNRYVFGAGDGENYPRDTAEELIPTVEQIPANMHAYVEVMPGSSNVASPLDDNFDDVATATVRGTEDVMDAIQHILEQASEQSQGDDT